MGGVSDCWEKAAVGPGIDAGPDSYPLYLSGEITAHLSSFSSQQVLLCVRKEILFRQMWHPYRATLIKSRVKTTALSLWQPSSALRKLPVNVFAFRAPVRSVLAAAGWPSEAAPAETVAGFPGAQLRHSMTSTRLAAAPTLCKQGSPAVFYPRLEKGPRAFVGKLVN